MRLKVSALTTPPVLLKLPDTVLATVVFRVVLALIVPLLVKSVAVISKLFALIVPVLVVCCCKIKTTIS